MSTEFYLQRSSMLLLYMQPECNIEARLCYGHTPLLGAILNGHSRIIERLVGYGADIHAQNENKDTALHLLANTTKFDAINKSTPELLKVKCLQSNSAFYHLVPINVVVRIGSVYYLSS